MALFESYERRIDQINAALNKYGISSIEEAEKITKDAGLDVYNQIKGIQPICFENACWAYIVGAAIAIKAMRENFPEMLVGAGTVLTTEQVDEAMAAGAQFIVTPGMDPDIVAYCQKVGIQIFPGCTTPTDYHTAYKFGLEVLKFFPAEQSGGIAKIKAMSAPFPMFKIMPTGGISLKNLADYVKNPVIAACGGSYMVTADLIDNGKWDEITDLCKQSVEIVKAARNG